MHLPNLRYTLPVFLAAGVFAADFTPTNVPSANPRIAGIAPPNILSTELFQTIVAQGSVLFEVPAGVTAGVFKYYGYNADAGLAMIPPTGSNAEFHKTEPDKNVYLILNNQRDADPSYKYGSHFLFQGHETGASGYLTRINLDADNSHRITLMANADVNGAVLPTFDGITWDPFAQHLLLTAEGSLGGGVWQATLDLPSKVQSLTGVIGQGGYEGIQADSQGRIFIVEDAGGSSGTLYPQAKRPNSFIYRFIPYSTSDLTNGGKLQALQLASKAHAGPITFAGSPSYATADDHIKSQDVADMHTYGLSFDTVWVTIHDTAVDGTTPFSANVLAKAKLATPFKRPENGQFRPETNFNEFVFDETGDTNLLTQAGTKFGGFGAIFRLRLAGDTGKLSLVYNGDAVHSSFDNCAFWDEDRIVFVEDAGDTLHNQRQGLDSAWLFNLDWDYSSGTQPIRILAQGRDVSATIDAGLLGSAGFVNEGDNEITGWHLSEGDASIRGLLGGRTPKPFTGGWRLFYTQQHGDNITFEVMRARRGDNHADDDD